MVFHKTELTVSELNDLYHGDENDFSDGISELFKRHDVRNSAFSFEVLNKLLSDSNPNIRRKAAEFIFYAPMETHAFLISKALNDENADVRDIGELHETVNNLYRKEKIH